MKLVRIVKHLLATKGVVRRAFPRHVLDTIENAIREGETRHAGEIQVVIEGGLDGMPLYRGQSARERAIELFSQLRVWDTRQNTGVLIYLLLADHAVEIVADRGIHEKVDQQAWNEVCRRMEAAFRQSDFGRGVLLGVQAVTAHLATHFPIDGSTNELLDRPVLL